MTFFIPSMMGFIQPDIYTPLILGAKLACWSDLSDFDSLSFNGSTVAQMNDLSGNERHWVQAEVARMVPYSADSAVANGKPSIIFPNTTSGDGYDNAASFLVKEWIIVCAYKDGLDSSFDIYNTLIGGLATNGEPRIMGVQTTADIVSTMAFSSTVSKNNGNFSSTMLPLPLSVCRFQGNATSGWRLGRNYGTYGDNRCWMGPICEIIGLADTLTAGEWAGLYSYLSLKWSVD